MLKPLADLIQREMDVMKAARRALVLLSKKEVKYEQTVTGVLELRSALSAWNAADAWQVYAVEHVSLQVDPHFGCFPCLQKSGWADQIVD